MLVRKRRRRLHAVADGVHFVAGAPQRHAQGPPHARVVFGNQNLRHLLLRGACRGVCRDDAGASAVDHKAAKPRQILLTHHKKAGR